MHIENQLENLDTYKNILLSREGYNLKIEIIVAALLQTNISI